MTRQLIPEPDAVTETNVLQVAASLAPRLRQLGAGYDKSRSFPIESFQLLRDALILEAPLDYAGVAVGRDHSLNTLTILRLLKHMGRGDLSVGRLVEGHVNALQLIATFGSREQQDEWFGEVRHRGMLFGVWNTEAADGVTLEPVGEGSFRLSGSKTFASGAGHVQRPIITGRLPDGGWQMCVVQMDRVEVSIDPAWWQPPGMHASTSFKVDFTDVRVGEDDLLGPPDAYHRQPWFSGGAIRFAAVQLGGAEALVDETRAFLQKLDRTGDPHQQARLGECAMLVEAGNLWLQGASATVDIGPSFSGDSDIEQVINYANMTRLAIEGICLDVMRLVERTVGARGLLPPVPIERILRDLMLYLRQPAPDLALTSVGTHILESSEETYGLWREE